MIVDSDRERECWAVFAGFLFMDEKGTRIENELLPLYIIMTIVAAGFGEVSGKISG